MNTNNPVNIEELKGQVELYYRCRKALFIEGKVGIGKSQTVKLVSKNIAEAQGREFIRWNELTDNDKFTLFSQPSKYFVFMDKRASQDDSSDNKGVPDVINPQMNGITDEKVKHELEKSIRWRIPLWLAYACMKDAAGLIFLDEFNLADESVQKSYYQLVLDRELGEYKLADGFGVVSAGNRIEDGVSVNVMGRPLKSRYGWVTLEPPTKEQYLDYARDNNFPLEIIAFLYVHGGTELHNVDIESAENAQPTPRNWENVALLLKQAEDASERQREIIVKSQVGDSCGFKYAKFCRMTEKVDIKELLDKPEKFDKLTEVDVKWACLPAICEIYKKDKNKMLEKVCDFALAIKEKDFAVYLLHEVKHCDGEQAFIERATKLKMVDKIRKLKEYIE